MSGARLCLVLALVTLVFSNACQKNSEHADSMTTGNDDAQRISAVELPPPAAPMEEGETTPDDSGEPTAPIVYQLVPYYRVALMEIHNPCTVPDRGIWVSASAADGGDGSYENPFREINPALERARTANLDICVESGEYDLGNNSLYLGMKDRLYGSVVRGETPTRSATPTSKLFNDGSRPVVQFLPTSDATTTLSGFNIKHSSASTVFSSEPLVLVRGGNPQIRQNTLETRQIPAEAGDGLKSIAIAVSTDEANVSEMLIMANTIRLAANASNLGSSVGILIQNRRDGTNLSATVRHNQIEVGSANILSAGVLAFGENVRSAVNVKIQKNQITFAEATKIRRHRSDSNSYTPGGQSLGVGLGLDYTTDSEFLNSAHNRGDSLLREKSINGAELSQNRILSVAAATSHQSTGIYLGASGTDRMDAIRIVNNLVQSGPARDWSRALFIRRPDVNIFHNTLRAGEVTSTSNRPIPPPCDICASGGGTEFTGRYASVITISGWLDASVNLANNILSARQGEGDVFGIYLNTDRAPFGEIKNNLFDRALTTPVARTARGGSVPKWNLAQLASEYPEMANPGAQSLTVSGNISDEPGLVNADGGDYHLANTTVRANNAGICLEDVRQDFEDQDRSTLEGCDIGADEI